jgi:hypothetical protein
MGEKRGKEGLIKKGVVRENASGIQHKYKVGDQVLLDKPGLLRKSTQPGNTYRYKNILDQYRPKQTRCYNWNSYSTTFDAYFS